MVKVIVKVHGYNWLQLEYSFLCTLVDDIVEYESHMRVFCCFHVFILCQGVNWLSHRLTLIMLHLIYYSMLVSLFLWLNSEWLVLSVILEWLPARTVIYSLVWSDMYRVVRIISVHALTLISTREVVTAVCNR